ncbi:ABC-2 family transporter protein [compost metagenome]
MSLWTLAYFIFLIATIFTADPARPRSTLNYTELGMFPLIIMVMTLLLGREFGGNGMEILATYPISLRWLAFRKWLLAIGLTLLANLGWMLCYILYFGKLRSSLYMWDGSDKIVSENALIPLFIQGLPAYLLVVSLVLCGTIIFQKTYGGLLFGFTYWIMDTLSSGQLLFPFSLYSNFLVHDHQFTGNRVALLLAAVLLLGIALWLVGRRERWIGREEE